MSGLSCPSRCFLCQSRGAPGGVPERHRGSSFRRLAAACRLGFFFSRRSSSACAKRASARAGSRSSGVEGGRSRTRTWYCPAGASDCGNRTSRRCSPVVFATAARTSVPQRRIGRSTLMIEVASGASPTSKVSERRANPEISPGFGPG